eukprot:GHRQ01037672.1.p2 GENE.GHRQ01037672.1~~GHRQ01037672.1.p2  ORF type:complete len:123 (-),score=16.70 GHRQ01037672.1:51-419(-)
MFGCSRCRGRLAPPQLICTCHHYALATTDSVCHVLTALSLSESCIQGVCQCCPCFPWCCPVTLLPTSSLLRPKMVEVLKKEFAEYGLTYSIGGQISFDVFPQVRCSSSTCIPLRGSCKRAAC